MFKRFVLVACSLLLIGSCSDDDCCFAARLGRRRLRSYNYWVKPVVSCTDCHNNIPESATCVRPKEGLKQPVALEVVEKSHPVYRDLAQNGHEDAMTEAAKAKVYLFVFFHAEWCEPCKRIEQTFNYPNVKEKLQKYLIYVVDVDREPELFELYKKTFADHPFTIRGIPAYFLVNPYTRRCERWGVGYRNPDEFINWLHYNK